MSQQTPAYSATPQTPGEIKFMGYGNPKYTGIPDLFLDEQMQDLTEAELKVMLYIFRRTFGFKKEQDTISYDQFLNGIRAKDGRQLDHGAGIARASLIRALNKLVERGYIFRHHRTSKGGDLTNIYELNIDGQPHYPDRGSQFETPGGSQNYTGEGLNLRPGLSSKGGLNFDPTRKQFKQKTDKGSTPNLTKNSLEPEPAPEPDIRTLSTEERLLRYARRNNLL